jgi:NADH-quinone oxidoreductase subunit E
MVNWEFFDNQTPSSARGLTDQLRSGRDVRPTRGAAKVCTFKEVSRVLAGFPDGRADEGVGAGPASLEGLRLARVRGWQAPTADDVWHPTGHGATASREPAREQTSAHDAPSVPAGDAERAGTVAGKPGAEATEGTAGSGGGTEPSPSGDAVKED